MIRMLEGDVVAVYPTCAIVSVGGVGYQVHTTPENLAQCTSVTEPLLFHTYLAVRENALDIYGFLDERELGVFELLLEVSGIGPKSALSVLTTAGHAAVLSAVRAQDASVLTKIHGVGKKTAEKIVLELKDKAVALGDAPHMPRGDEEALEALRAMGYTLAEAREALKRVPRDVVGGSARLKEALRALSPS